MIKTVKKAEIKFLKTVKVNRANQDGTRRVEIIKKGETRIVPLASANYRYEREEAIVTKYIDVPAENENSLPSVIELPPVQDDLEDVVQVTKPVPELLKELQGAIAKIDMVAIKSALGKFNLDSFSNFVNENETLPRDSVLVISEAIEEFKELQELKTITISDLKDAVNYAIEAVS